MLYWTLAFSSLQGAGTDGDGGVARMIRFLEYLILKRNKFVILFHLGRSRLCRVPPSMSSKGTEVEVEGVMVVRVVLVVMVVVQVGWCREWWCVA